MGRALLDNPDHCDPDTLKLLGRAFDETWPTVGEAGDSAAMEDRRTRLAVILLHLACEGERDMVLIKERAAKIMREKDSSPVAHGRRAAVT